MTMHTKHAACAAALLAVVFALAAGAARADDWPQFRGPGGDGVAAAADPPLAWDESRGVLWKVATPGRGRSSPVVLGDRIWLTTAYETPDTPENARRRLEGLPDAGDLEVCASVRLGVLCLDRATGKILYEREVLRVDQPQQVHKMNSFATPTPVVEPGRVYCDFGAMGTVCVDAATGDVVWQQRLPIDHLVGPGSSPVLYKNLLLLVRDGCDAQFIAALDTKTGQVAWKTDRPPLQTRGDLKKAYSTPLIIEAAGRTQAIIPGAQWVVSYDPASGKELWRVHHGTGFSLAPRPVYGDGLVYISTGCVVARLLAIRVDGQGDVTGTHVAWKATENIPVLSSPLLVGKALYTVSDSGKVTCFDARTGEVQWQARAKGTHLASPVYAGGRLYFFSREGRTTVFGPGAPPEPLAENVLDGVVSATPAFVGRAILLRTDTHLYCLGAAAAP
ncbi:MAG: PQQ-binding-like beta-propeller repeat protein [Acidobacteria bacterium]|nr:PQQ-binding-like beta-propeller repeat protein [Acidobacteriota bacterium]